MRAVRHRRLYQQAKKEFPQGSTLTARHTGPLAHRKFSGLYYTGLLRRYRNLKQEWKRRHEPWQSSNPI